MELKEKTDNLLEHAGDYLDTYYKLALLKVAEKTSRVSSSIIASLAVIVFVLFVLLFAGLGLSWWIGEMLDNMVAGFFIVAGIFLLMIFLIKALKKKTINPWIRNIIVKNIYEQDDNNI